MNNTISTIEISDISVESESLISLEHILYDAFYRKHAIRRLTHFDNPIISDLTQAHFPKHSIYHYNPESPLLFGPMENNPWFKNDKNPRFIKHIFEYPFQPIGTIVKRPGSEVQFINAYKRKHRTLRVLRDFFGVNKQPNLLIVYNYCILNQLWKYRPHRFVNYYKFTNMYTTIIKTIDKVAKQSERNQFFEIRLPKIILPRAQYRMYAKEYIQQGITNRILKYFNDEDSLLLLHFWIWLGGDKKNSIFRYLDEKTLKKINLIFTDNNKYTVMNLGDILSWQGEASEDGFEVDDEDSQDKENNEHKSSDRLQVKFHRLLETFVSLRTGSGVTELELPTYTEKELLEAGNDNEIDKDDEDEAYTEPTSLPDNKQSEDIDPVKQEKKSKSGTVDLKELNNEEDDYTIPNTELPSDQKDAKKDTVEVVYDNNQDILEEPTYLPTEETEQTSDPMLSSITEDALEMVNAGMMSAKQYERIKKLAESYKTAPSPYNVNETLEETSIVDPELVNNIDKTKIPDNDWILDKSMLSRVTEDRRRIYLEKVYHRNIVQNILSLQKAGIIVSDIKRDIIQDVSGAIEELKVQVQPIDGNKSTLTIQLPVIDPDTGTFMLKGTKYQQRQMRRDLPIRKVSPVKVALTTFYGKINVQKSDRKTFNLEKYLIPQMQLLAFSGKLTDLEYGNMYDSLYKNIPVIYSIISKRFKHFVYRNRSNQDYYCSFSYSERYKIIAGNGSKEEKQQYVNVLEEKHDGVLFASSRVGTRVVYYFINRSGFVNDSNNATSIPFELFMEFVSSPPLEMAEIVIFGKAIPIVIALGYYLGLTKLCRLLNVKPRKIFRGQRANLLNNEYAIKFNDETWIFDKTNYAATLILNGLNHYKRYIQDYSAEQFETKDVYSAIIRDAGLPTHLENEFTLMRRMFIDDISRMMLIKMKEPTEFIPLLIRSVELLTTLWSRDEINMEDMVITGVERIAGQVYTELVKNIKNAKNNQSITARKRFDLAPNHMLTVLNNDPSIMLVDDINPIQNMKEHDAVTFNGLGGRTNRTMVKHTRKYHETDLGTISEATVDNQSVGVNTFLTAAPKVNSLYGTTDRLEETDGSANIFSTTNLLGVGIDSDDPKRQLFKGIQDSHTVAIEGAIPNPVRTGYESIVAHRVDKKFAFVSREAGKVVEKSDNHILLKYESGKKESCELGTIYGVSAGHVIPNRMISDYPVGKTFTAGEVIAFNPSFFSRDIFNKTQVLFKNATLMRTSFMETNDTEEDSSAISERYNDAFTTPTVETRVLVIPFEDRIEKMKIEGDTVEADSILCTLINTVFSDTTMFGDDTLETLENLAQSSPKAKHAGVITKIEVFYYGDPDTANISPSVKRIIKRYDYDRQLLANKLQDGRPENGRLLNPVMINGNQVPLNHVAIKFYIENKDGLGIGD